MACTEEDKTHKKERYKEVKRAAKKAVVEAKYRAFKAFYQKFDTKEGEKFIFILAKSRSRQKKDLGTLKFIKEEGGRVIKLYVHNKKNNKKIKGYAEVTVIYMNKMVSFKLFIAVAAPTKQSPNFRPHLGVASSYFVLQLHCKNSFVNKFLIPSPINFF